MTKAPKKTKKFNQNSAIRSAIRRIFSRSPSVIDTLKKGRRERTWYKKDGSSAKKPRVEYRCNSCDDFFMGKDVQVDHEDPVVDPVAGFVNWETFIERLFCSMDNLQILCSLCHKVKTDEEKRVRAVNRKLNKAKDTTCQ